MTQFDGFLRQGLMDANLAQYERVLQNADAAEADFSPSYLRERMRLLADPWGWMRRRELTGRRRGRLNWRLIAVIAALLLLSACAYAVATGQFSQWFPRLGVDPRAPEVSEEVLTQTGTVIGQSQTAGGGTVTLNAAVWDGYYLQMSLVIEAPGIPEELIPDSELSWAIYTEECRLSLSEEDWKEYVRKDIESRPQPDDTEEKINELVQRGLDMGQKLYEVYHNQLNFVLLEREGDTLTFNVNMVLENYLEKPELTFHIENMAIYEDGKGQVTWNGDQRTGPGPGETFLAGPFDFTFTLEKALLPVKYAGDVSMTVEDIPFRFTGFEIAPFNLDFEYEVPVPVDNRKPDEDPEPGKLDGMAVRKTLHGIVQGLWTKDGRYVDLSQIGGSLGIGTPQDESRAYGSVGSGLPFPVDPAAVTAVKLGETRVELSELERLDE